MRHEIPVLSLGPQGPAVADAVGACVHCGFCLPTCPTYRVLGEEMDSPRGRIVLMKEVLEGRIEFGTALPYLDRCLGCLACVTACPSGVQYGELITAFRGHAEGVRHRPLTERAFRAAALETLSRPERAAPLGQLGALARALVPGPVAERLPGRARAPLGLLPGDPRKVRRPKPLPEIVPARGRRRARVALLAGCVQQVLDQQINWATLRVLTRNGIEVVVPRGQVCCGALALHTGDQARARRLARQNLDAFGARGSRVGTADQAANTSPGDQPANTSPGDRPASALPADGENSAASDPTHSVPSDVDAVITNAAGCGAGLREYGLLFAGDPDEERAQVLASRVRDVAEFLDEIGLADEPPALPRSLTVVYHDACHLAHAQDVRAQPRRLLSAIPNLTIAEPAEWELCCGSAGTYNLEQPAIAEQLGRRKADNLEATRAQAIVAGNIGCLTQIGRFSGLPLYHTMQLLDFAYRRKAPTTVGRSG